MSTPRVLVTWVADRDFCALHAALPGAEKSKFFHEKKGELYIRGEKRPLRQPEKGDSGPVGTLLGKEAFDEVVILSDRKEKLNKRYRDWAKDTWGIPQITVEHAKIKSAFDYKTIYKESHRILSRVRKRIGPGEELSIHLSPGTRAMGSIFLLLGKNEFAPAVFFQVYGKKPERVEVPFALEVALKEELERQGELLGFGSEDATELIGNTSAMREIKADIKRFSRFPLSCLVIGETGCGKELIARLFHESGPKKNGKFVPINCGAIPDTLVESELFGYEKGAFTGANKTTPGKFEQADGGTLFLDEIGDMPMDLQVKLLRAVQEKKFYRVAGTEEIEVDIQIVSATNQNIEKAITEGKFRADLYYRLTDKIIRVPPLRERKQDIDLLSKHFMKNNNKTFGAIEGHAEKRLSRAALHRLKKHGWPGNVRELESVLRRAWIFTPPYETEIGPQEIVEALADFIAPKSNDSPPLSIGEGFSLKTRLDELEKQYIEEALDRTNGIKSQAAKLLGISAQSLNGKLNKLG